MEKRYASFGERLRARMADVGIATNRELGARLEGAKCSVGENMISRWTTGQSRPQGANLEAVLDVLGILGERERSEWRVEAHWHRPTGKQAASNRLAEDDTPTEVIDRPGAS